MEKSRLSPWLIGLIKEFSDAHPGAELHEMYERYLEDHPGTSWKQFLVDTAILARTKKKVNAVYYDGPTDFEKWAHQITAVYEEMARIDELLQVVDDNTPADDRNSIELVLLSDLVAEYEDVHYPIKKPSLINILKLRMYEMGLSQNGLAALLEMNQSKISEILSGKSEPTLKQARRIASALDIPPAIVLGE